MKKHSKIAICVLILLSLGALLFGEAKIRDTRIVLTDRVIDLRPRHRLPKKVGNEPRGFHTPEELEIGSVFIDANNEARKVVDIYEQDGRTVIETEQPQIEEAISSFTIPDQQVSFTSADIIPGSVAEGVTILNDDVPVPSIASRATIDQKVKWLETDPEWMGQDVISIYVDKVLWSGSKAKEMDFGGKKDESGKTKPGTSSLASVSGTAEVRIEGIIRIAEPKLDTGAKMPVMNIEWVHVWGPFYYPDISFEDGYLKAEFSAAQQTDCTLSGSVGLSAEVKIPLYALAAQDAKGNSFIVGIYLKATAEGSITVAFEISEYTNFTVWGNVDIFWPFIPYDIRVGASSYGNFALRPSIAAEIEARTGVYLGLDATVLGFGIFGAEAGGGLYANAQGYMEAKGILGYATDYGGYGSMDDWLYDITLELGAYVEANLSVLLWDVDLFEKKWPIKTIGWSGEF